MECLKDYIGINGCKPTNPESGMFVNDLPGITLKSFQTITDDEQMTFIDIWSTIQRRAINRINTAIVNTFGTRYKLNAVSQFAVLPEVINTTTNQTAAAADYRGFMLTIGGDRWVSALQVIHVQALRLYLKADVNTTIKFYNIIGTVLTEIHSIAVTGKAGWNNINVNQNFFGYTKIFVGYDATAISSVESKFDTTNDAECFDALLCDDYGLVIRPAKYASGTVTTGNNTFGLAGVVSVKCMFEMVVCNNKSTFGQALLYLLGEETMAERIYSDRLNRYTTIELNRAKELREEFGIKYELELKTAINGLSLSMADTCLTCNQVVTSVEMRP